jgi:hypothetical protein
MDPMKTQPTNKNFAFLMAVVLAVFQHAPPAKAAFHLWEIDEVYSSADGAVQFIELTALSGSQQFLANQQIRSTNSAGVNTFTFPTNLPADSGGRTCLIGTTNVALVPGGVLPNYIIPPNFIRRPTGVGSAAVIFNPRPSTVVTANLPADGESALRRSGGAMAVVPTNSPRNFAFQSNSIVPVRFLSANKANSDFLLSFRTATGVNGAAGPNYAIENSGTVAPASWSVATNVAGNGNVRTLALPINLATNQVFRLRVP